jgi:hypothetical protein
MRLALAVMTVLAGTVTAVAGSGGTQMGRKRFRSHDRCGMSVDKEDQLM